MPDAEFKITNGNSDEIIRTMHAALPPILETCGLVAEGYAKRLCPVDTGRLRNSITHATKANLGQASYTDNDGNRYTDGAAKETPDEYEVVIGTNVDYAQQQELGNATHKVGQSPYLRPALADHIAQYKEIIEEGLKNA